MANFIQRPRLPNIAGAYQTGQLARNRFDAGQIANQTNAFNLENAQQNAPLNRQALQVKIDQSIAQMDSDQLKQAMERMKNVGYAMDVYSQNPLPQQEAEYPMLRRMTAQMGAADWPEQYDPNFIAEKVAESKYVLSQMEEAEANFGIQPQYATDAEGNITAYQLNKMGGAKAIDLPGGQNWVDPRRMVDLGNQVIPVGQRTGRQGTPLMKGIPPAQQPAAVAETVIAKEEAKQQIQAEFDLPKVQAEASDSIRLVDELIKHPGLEYAVGKSSVLPVIPGTPSADFVVRLEQIQGKQFLSAFQALKGAGQITEIEGQKATQAVARMQRKQSESEFIKGAMEFKQILMKGLARARNEAKRPMKTKDSGWSIRRIN